MRKTMLLLVCGILVLSLHGCKSDAAKEVDGYIEAIGTVDAGSGPVLEYVRSLYEALPEEDRVMAENVDQLLAAEAAYADCLIDAVGAVTLESEQAIVAAENAYDGLTEEAKEKVAGLEALQEARKTFDRMALMNELTGVWVNEVTGYERGNGETIGRGLIRNFGLDETNCNPAAFQALADGGSHFTELDGRHFTLHEDGMISYGGAQLGHWEVSADGKTVTLNVQDAEGKHTAATMNVIREDGFTKLVGAVFGNQTFGYVREEAYRDAFYQKYEVVELTRENIHDYLDDPVLLGKIENDNGKKYNAYVLPSRMDEQGLIYIGSSCVIPIDYVHGGKPDCLWLENPLLFLTRLKMKDVAISTDSRISGELYYIREEYVAENRINGDGIRTLELTNGVTMVFDGYTDMENTFWNRVDAVYNDYLY